MQLHLLKQGSEAWLDERKKYCVASQAAAAMGCGRFTPRNPEELVALWKGEIKITRTKAMAHGIRNEPKARALCEWMLSEVFQPASFSKEVDGVPLWASLDGVTLDREVMVEIKCPYQGKNSELWKFVETNGGPPGYYYWQLVHQYLVCPAQAYFIVYDAADNSVLVRDMTEEVSRKDSQKALLEAWKEVLKKYRIN